MIDTIMCWIWVRDIHLKGHAICLGCLTKLCYDAEMREYWKVNKTLALRAWKAQLDTIEMLKIRLDIQEDEKVLELLDECDLLTLKRCLNLD